MKLRTKIGFGLATALILIGGIGTTYYYYQYKNEPTPSRTKTYTVDGDTLTLNIDSTASNNYFSDLKVTQTTGDQIKIKYGSRENTPYTFKSTQNGDHLSIRTPLKKSKIASRFLSHIQFGGFDSRRVTISIPNKIKHLTLNGEGYTSLDNFQLDSFQNSGHSLRTSLYNSTIKKVSVDKNSSSLMVSNSDINQINLKNSNSLDLNDTRIEELKGNFSNYASFSNCNIKKTTLTAHDASLDVDSFIGEEMTITGSLNDSDFEDIAGNLKVNLTKGDINFETESIRQNLDLKTERGDINLSVDDSINNAVLSWKGDKKSSFLKKLTSPTHFGQGTYQIRLENTFGELNLTVDEASASLKNINKATDESVNPT